MIKVNEADLLMLPGNTEKSIMDGHSKNIMVISHGAMLF